MPMIEAQEASQLDAHRSLVAIVPKRTGFPVTGLRHKHLSLSNRVLSRLTEVFKDCTMMSHQYRGDEDQDYTYNKGNAYSIAHASYQSYSNQLSVSYSQPSLDPSGSLPSQYPSSQSLFAQSIYSLPTPGYHYSQPYSHARYLPSARYFSVQDMSLSLEIESQESCNEDTMLSEPVYPVPEGFPDVREFDQLMINYVKDLSVKKQDKALIHAKRARNIRSVLMAPKETAVESAQFRFWAKKMFRLLPADGRTPNSKRLICHEGKPVAIREKLFKILTKAHQQCQHGGRDKTSAKVREKYSWVPKELISRFVKICPTCQIRRGGPRITPPASLRNSPNFDTVTPSQPPPLLSPPDSRRESVVSRPSIGSMSRPEQSHTYTYSWGNSRANGNHQYQTSMPPVSSITAWGTLPRSISGGGVDSAVGNGMSVSSHQLDYAPSYGDSHLNGPHQY
ncbi:hypothetical protein VTO42DRAFT_4651 [Malbranchea cinnamomea]